MALVHVLLTLFGCKAPKPANSVTICVGLVPGLTTLSAVSAQLEKRRLIASAYMIAHTDLHPAVRL